jgi:5-oxoprolinase (ATP-hydrolysing)
MRAEWQIWIDTGGTFTDGLGLDPEGRLHRVKILSTGALRGTLEGGAGARRLRVGLGWDLPPDFIRGFRFRLLGRPSPDLTVSKFDPAASLLELSDDLPGDVALGAPFEVVGPEEAPVLAARILTRTAPGARLPEAAMRLGTTLATNALLERRGAPTALFITRGFGDLLRIGTQQRPDLFALEVRVPDPLYAAVVEVPERLAADGSILEPLAEGRVAEEAQRLARQGIEAAAVALLHADLNPRHEERVEEILRACGFRHVSRSSDLAPFIRLLHRAETAVVDACLAPVVRGHLDRVRSHLEGGRLHVMTSAGGLAGPEAIRPKDTLLSGPAGGVVGAALAGRRSGFGKIIAFDMGGTSTDVARWDGDYEYEFEQRVGAAHLVAPALAIESVAAGGGSICWFDGDRLRVGPRSAGASPGPACYGAGGPLTLTDVNLLLGRLDPGRFGIPIRPEGAAAELETLRASLARRTGECPEPEAFLTGFLEIADERMADAIRSVSLRRGYDPADHALVAFGGAGGQHACGVADRLGIATIVVPPDAGLLSALGLGHAVIERFAELQVIEPLGGPDEAARIRSRIDDLARRAVRAVEAEGVPPGAIEVRRRVLHLRFAGQDSTVDVEYDEGVPLRVAFEARYRALYGHGAERRPVELESIRVIASSRAPDPVTAAAIARPAGAPPVATRRACLGSAWREVPVFDRDDLAPGALFDGPALVFESHGATVVDPGWRVTVDGTGALVIRRAAGAAAGAARAPAGHPRPEAVWLELFTNRFRAIATEMGERLRRTAISTNIKERLDLSCALLDAGGELVVNAPHIPVHLGALGLCVRRLREAIPMEPGDMVVTNHPAFGGSHLPDVTVVTPVFPGRGASGELLGYVASRAHHAEIGGTRPGSMPPSATTLAEEGVVIPPTYLIRRGEARWDEIRSRLEEAPLPSRAVEDNLADLRAAAAANHAGAEALRALAEEHGAETVRRAMESLQGLAERRIREALGRIPPGRYEATETLDDGSPLRAAVLIAGDRATIDFQGSSGRHPGNLNATPAIVRSVVIYVLRLLLREPLPLNEGLLRAVSIRIPPGILDPGFPEDPSRAPAIVGGNVETSQRLVDTLLKALGVAACSQGTMNNVLFGNERFGYYETICGGCGAGPGFHGASAVHSHMTNTRITDPEVIERRYPVRVERFAIRRGSGGAGRYRGGDGAVREITFLAPMSLSILSQHRTVRPYGLDGGEPGMPGAQRLVRSTGEVVELGPLAGCEVGPGDRLIIETPGGGGYGAAGSDEGGAGTGG